MNQKTIVFALALLFIANVFAQEKRTIKVIVPDASDEVYITGNQDALGNWDPGTVKMKKVSDFEREVVVDISYPAEFKFTKGQWDNEGIVNDLENNPNQKLENSDSRNIFMIKAWANDSNAGALGLDYDVKNFKSKYLEADRQIQIVLPKNYDPTKKYPVFYTTDAGWNIFSVVKNYMANLSLEEYKLMPESILVGIVHGSTNGRSNRNDDLDVYYGESGKKFKDFVFKELVPYINTTYSTSEFNVMIGHSNGAEYNHFLLLEEENPFRGFISFSTNFFAKDVRQEIGDFMKTYSGKNMYYFVANATSDSPDRIEAGDDYEKLYEGNTNVNFHFKKNTYEANHNSVVPLALVDGIRFVFKDYRNLKNYTNLATYVDHYLEDMKANYGIKEAYSITDMDPVFTDIMKGKKKDELEVLLQFVEDEKLWKFPKMKEAGGFDGANKGNFYYIVEDYKKSAENYTLAFDQIHTFLPPVIYLANFKKAITAFNKIEDYDGLMDLMLKTKAYLNTTADLDLEPKRVKYYQLFFNYHIVKLANEQGMQSKEVEEALVYCTENYQKNKIFTMEELQALK